MMKELLNSVADKYIFSNISLFNFVNKVYLYSKDGTCEELGEGTHEDLPVLIAEQCFKNNIDYVRIHGNKIFVNPIVKNIEKEVNKKNCEFSQKINVKVVVD